MCNAWNHSSGCECGFGPPYNRDLAGFFDQRVGDTGGRDLSSVGRTTERLRESVGDRDLATQLASTFLWQSYVGSADFRWPYRPRARSKSVEIYVVRHGRGWPRHDLLILDPHLQPDQVIEGQVQTTERELRNGWFRFGESYLRDTSLPRWLSRLQVEDIPEIAVEAMKAQPHFFIAMCPPKIVRTARSRRDSPSVASPAMGVSTRVSGVSLSTVGVIASDKQGRRGVTTALHAFEKRGAGVFIKGKAGRIRARDAVTDSCFIEVADPDFSRIRRCKGPLNGVTPRGGESVWFDGVTSGRTKTEVLGWTLELPFWIPGIQSRVLTPPVTEQGDSGAALVNKQGEILGFAKYRTGVNERAPHSGWIWAASVFATLNLH